MLCTEVVLTDNVEPSTAVPVTASSCIAWCVFAIHINRL